MLILVPSNFHLIWAACQRQAGGFKPVIGLSPGYGDYPHIPDIPPMFCHHCVPAVFSVFLQIVTKGCEWLRGAALRCPPLTSSSSLLFNSLTSVLTWTDRLPIHPLSVPHSPSSSPCIILSVSLLALEQCRFAHRRNHRRFRINSCLFLYKVDSLSLSSCFLTHFFL